MPNRRIIRLASAALMVGAGGMFAVNAGLVPGLGDQPSASQSAEVAAPAPQIAAASVTAPTPTVPTDRAAAPTPAMPEPIETAAVVETAPLDMPALPSTPEFAPVQPDLPETGNLSDRMSETPDTPMTAPEDGQAVSQFGLPCGLSVTASAAPAAMVALDIMDPCQPNARVLVGHSGLTIVEATDGVGLLTLDIPAFESPAFFTVQIGDTEETALVTIPDLTDYDRVAVAWEDTRDLELHAMEFGATYGEPGHIWQENAGDLTRAIDGEGGFLTQLGSDEIADPMMAQVYSFPRDTLAGRGAVRLSIEAPINTRNCGEATMARTLETAQDGPVEVTELTFTLPECDAVGDYLVLQNLLQDLRVASN